MDSYNFSEIEKKWQDRWEKEKRFEVKNHENGKENTYLLIEFPYPSGKGLHTGHVRSYTRLMLLQEKREWKGKMFFSQWDAMRLVWKPKELQFANINFLKKLFQETLKLLNNNLK